MIHILLSMPFIQTGGILEGFGGGFGNFSDIFEDFFGDLGGRSSKRREQRGQDLKYEIDVDLRSLYWNKKRNFF